MPTAAVRPGGATEPHAHSGVPERFHNGSSNCRPGREARILLLILPLRPPRSQRRKVGNQTYTPFW
jgi:hypothetical protein